MSMNRERIIYVIALLLVFAGVFAVYKFYFSAKLEQYAKHEETLNKLQDVERKLKQTFGAKQPDDVIRDYNGKVEAWNEAIALRVPFFNDEDWREHETPPTDVFILQFWYGDESRRMVEEVWEKAQRKYGAQVFQRMPEGFPGSLQSMLGVVYAEDWRGRDVKAENVNEQLERLSYGISALEMLMDADALQISLVGIEKLGEAGFIGQGINYTRLRLSFTMEAKALVDFLEGIRQEDRFYSVQGMRIAHPYILARYEPQLEVDMFLIRATPEEEGFDTTLAKAAPSAAALYEGGVKEEGVLNSISPRRARIRAQLNEAEEVEPGVFGKAWKWFKRYVLYTN